MRKNSVLALFLVCGAMGCGSARIDQANETLMSLARTELSTAADQFKVKIDTAQAVQLASSSGNLIQAPVTGSDRYTDANLAAGADMTFLYVQSTRKLRVPGPGFYLARATVAAGAAEGRVDFLDSSRAVVGTAPFFVRDLKALDGIFPGTSDPPSGDLPNIHSTHVLRNGKYWVDCMWFDGSNRVAFYPMD